MGLPMENATTLYRFTISTVTSLGVSARSFRETVTFQCGGRGVSELSWRKVGTALTGNLHGQGLSSLLARGRPARFTPVNREVELHLGNLMGYHVWEPLS
ncbi:hypothetical protein E1301_Tti009412 [Triplophysa tibetana]|uniref:Uncharacterized protein n=1 Tax=Triplophysa tibetana TaxID=1572043 RepID=A0A5A9P4B2_9TELE|nr:hypothetical protein E1301_Tti009412 [Triplophysa tibetana]